MPRKRSKSLLQQQIEGRRYQITYNEQMKELGIRTRCFRMTDKEAFFVREFIKMLRKVDPDRLFTLWEYIITFRRKAVTFTIKKIDKENEKG